MEKISRRRRPPEEILKLAETLRGKTRKRKNLRYKSAILRKPFRVADRQGGSFLRN